MQSHLRRYVAFISHCITVAYIGYVFIKSVANGYDL